MRKFDEIILTFFFCGKIKKAPGTFSSAASALLWLLITTFFCSHNVGVFWQNIFWIAVVLSAFCYGIAATPGYVKRVSTTGEIDNQSITLDEFVGQIIALQLSFIPVSNHYLQSNWTMAIHVILGFALFRYFDIKKPSFIGEIDRQMKNEFGVMVDDVLSGIAAAAVASLVMFFF